MKALDMLMVAALPCACAVAATVVDDIPLSNGEAREITVSSGTDTYSGTISGDGSLVKKGNGTLVLSGGNTFTGGIAVKAGVLQADSGTAFGTGTVTMDAGQMILNAATPGFTPVVNDIVVNFNMSDNGIQTKTNTLMSGRISSNGKTVYLCQTAKNTGSPTGGGNSSIHGDIDVGNGELNLNSYGTMSLTGKVTAATVNGGTRWSSGGYVELWNPQNDIGEWRIASEHVKCMSTNVMQGILSWALKGGARNNCNIFMLNGYDQTIAGITYTLGTNSDWNKQITNTAPEQITVKSSPAATLTIRGRETDCACWSKIQKGVTLVLDAVDYPDFSQSFNYQANLTDGPIIVSNGTFAVSNNATFKNVTRIDVASGGQLTIDDTVNAFTGVTTLSMDGKMTITETAIAPFTGENMDLVLGEDAEVTLPASMTLTVKSLTVNGTPKSGMFSSSNLPQLKQGRLLTITTDVTPVSWTALGENDLMTTEDNWSAMPDLRSGAFLPTFAAGTRASAVYADTFFNGIRFAGANGFTIGGANGNAALYLGPGGIAAAESEETSATYVIDVPVKRMGGNTAVYAPKGQSITFRDTFNDEAADTGNTISIPGLAKNAVANLGMVSFEGTNVVAGQIVSTSAVWRVSGILGTPGHAYEGMPTEQSLGAIVLRVGKSGPENLSGDGTHGIKLDNAMIEKSIWISTSIGEKYLWAPPNTTNEIKGFVKFSGLNWQGITLEPDSETTFSGGMEASHSFRIFSGGTLRIKDIPVKCVQYAGFNPRGGKAIFEVPGNTFNNLILGYSYGGTYNDTMVEMTVSYAMTNGCVQVGGDGNGYDKVSSIGNGTHVLDIHCTTQRCQKLGVMKRGTLTGEYPAMLEVIEGRQASDPIGYSVIGAVTGGVGLHLCGTGTLMLTNKAFASCGDLKVSNGVMEFAEGGSWLNGTNVTVCGTGILKIGSADTFNSKTAVIRFADSGMMDIPAGVMQVFAEGWDGETKLTGGKTYTSANLASRITGGGSLRISGQGLNIVLR